MKTSLRPSTDAIASSIPQAPGERVLALDGGAEQFAELLAGALAARATAATGMNAHSSRSHLLVTVYVEQRDAGGAVAASSKLQLIDLAGSEVGGRAEEGAGRRGRDLTKTLRRPRPPPSTQRIAKSGAQARRKDEAIKINGSLLALGDVMAALGARRDHVPYRRSKLTHLLQDSLAGSAQTAMFVTVSPLPACHGESVCALRFGEKVAQSVELGRAKKNLAGNNK